MNAKMREVKKREYREGFSLIELIIAIAIVGIVMSGVLLLITYATNSMRRTNNQVTIQNQAKDALTHITTHLQEASGAKFYDDGTRQVLIAVKAKDYEGAKPKRADVDIYWTGTIGSPSTSDEDNVIFYTSWTYPEKKTGTVGDVFSDYDYEHYFTTKGEFNYKKFLDGDLTAPGTKQIFDSEVDHIFDGKDARSFILCRNVNFFKEGAVSGDAVVPVTGAAAGVSGDFLAFALKLKNDTGDTEFTTSKTVYFRNQ